jgi:hypothetical protein
MAWAEEAHARLRVYAGTLGGSWGRRLTSRATFGTIAEATTWLNTTSSISRPSISPR